MWKLDAAQKVEAIASYSAGEAPDAIGSRLGVSGVAIRGIVRRRGGKLRSLSEAMRHLPLNQDAFAYLSPEVAYWAGFLMADGSIGGREEVALVLAVRDSEHIRHFRAFLGSGHAITAIQQGSHQTCRFSFRSAKIVADLSTLGVKPRKTYDAKATPVLAEDRDFWRGVVDGDGYIGLVKGRRPRLELVGALPLLEQFAAFANHAAKSKVHPHPHKSIWRISLMGATARLVIDLLYRDSSVALERKRNASLNILSAGMPAGWLT